MGVRLRVEAEKIYRRVPPEQHLTLSFALFPPLPSKSRTIGMKSRAGESVPARAQAAVPWRRDTHIWDAAVQSKKPLLFFFYFK